jgi:uncharacterized repeat protein (TIGR02543 family)
VTLAPTPAAGWVFTGWSGACSGTGNCTMSMTAQRSVTATFTQTRILTVSVTGNGTVTSKPAGINCPGDCTESYNTGTSVTLTATSAAGSVFSGWSGGGITCPGTGTCTVTLDQARTVTATFVTSSSWAFTVIAGVTQQTADYYGGYSGVSALIRTQMDTVMSRFNYPGVFAAVLQFVVDSVYVFAGDAGAETCKPHPAHDYRIVYDGFPASGGGWLGSCQAVYHSWPASYSGGTFGPNATDGLAHELGHARGAIDLYALEVDPTKNSISGQPYQAEVSIMNNPYGIRVWDKHSVFLIDANSSVKAPPIDYITNAFPSAMGVTVVSAAGAPVPGVTIELFPVEWFSRTVGGTPVLTGVTDSKGELLFQVNPFEPNSSGFPWNIHYSNLLVRATAGGNRSYMWLPLTAAQVFTFTNPGTPFWLTIVI